MTPGYQCTDCGEPLIRGRCPDRECDTDPRQQLSPALAEVVLRVASTLELPPPDDPRSVLP